MHRWMRWVWILFVATAPAQEREPLARFTRYTEYNPLVPVHAMPGEQTFHRFFDTSPISPSGRYLALFRMPYEGRAPAAGDAGEVVLVDLRTGTSRVVARSRGWEVQVGANVQWGRSDRELYFNDVEAQTWRAFAVRLDPETGERREMQGTVFMVSPDGATLASHNLIKSRRAQVGYGVVVPDEHMPKNAGPVADDGVYLTDTATGQTRMLVSIRTLYEQAEPSIRIPNPEDHEYYCFQVKWNPQGTRLLTTLQWTPRTGGPRQRTVLTMNADGTQIRTAITAAQWAKGGHHVNWCRDGERLSMNLNIDDTPDLEIITVRCDGTGMRAVFKPGSGHPSFHPNGRYIVTDAYPNEKVAFGDGTVPIRLIDTQSGTCRTIARIFVSSRKGEFRVDPHPVWDASGRYVVFNGFAGNQRRVYRADLQEILAGGVAHE